MVVSDEELALNGLRIRDRRTGESMPIERSLSDGYEGTLEKNPEACWTLNVPATAVWLLPEEPWKEHGGDWHFNPRLLAAHRTTVKRSLESFLNRNLAQLDKMARSGWFIIERVRTKVSELREVAHRPDEKPRSASMGSSLGKDRSSGRP